MSTTVNASNAFEIEDVSVAYGIRRFVAVDHLSLGLERGGALALLGLNGAGKTSTIRLLMGMVRPRTGRVSVFGVTPGATAALRRIGFAPEEATPPEHLTGEEYLTFVAGFRVPRDARKDAVTELMTWFELPQRKLIRGFSKGMRRKLILAQALLGNPDFLILDEPLGGLDPIFIMKLRSRIETYLKGGGTLLFSSHILAEVEKVCDRIAIVKGGKLQMLSPYQQICEQFGSVEKAFAHYVGG